MIIFEQNKLRISLITSRLLRVETGAFTDLATQTVINRDFEKAEYNLEQKGDILSVITHGATFNVTLSTGDVKSIRLGESTITDFSLQRKGDIVEISVSADGFLYNMVRIIAGTVIDIAHGKIDADSLAEIIESKDRSRAGQTAPPYGLYLNKVFY